jgi:hypothetical protein
MAQYHPVQLLGHLLSETDMTKLLFFLPKHTQHGLNLRGMEVSDHLHASADLRVMHPSVSQSWSYSLTELRYIFGNDHGHNVTYHNDYELDCAATFLISLLS